MPRHGGRSIAAQGVEQQAIQKTQSNQNGDHDLGWNVHVVETVNVDQIKRKVAQHHGKGDQSNFLEVPVTRVTEDINVVPMMNVSRYISIGRIGPEPPGKLNA